MSELHDLTDQHYWVDAYLNDGLRCVYHFHGKEALIEGMNELIVAAGEEISVPVAENMYGMQQTVAIMSNRFGIELRFEVQPAYTEEQMIAAGYLDDPKAIQLDPIWQNMFEEGSNATVRCSYD